jgi:hypothetical protein
MTEITATVSSQPITATVSGSGNISASVGSSSISASVAGGIGPPGPAGSSGAALGDLSGVTLTNVQDGDVLQYQSSKWQNVNQIQLVDGGNA